MRAFKLIAAAVAYTLKTQKTTIICLHIHKKSHRRMNLINTHDKYKEVNSSRRTQNCNPLWERRLEKDRPRKFTKSIPKHEVYKQSIHSRRDCISIKSQRH